MVDQVYPSPGRIAVTQCSVSSRPVYITQHLSQLFVPGDIDSFLRLRPRGLICRSFCRATGLSCPSLSLSFSLLVVMLECSGSANTRTDAFYSARFRQARPSSLMGFVYFCFESSRCESMGRYEYPGDLSSTRTARIYRNAGFPPVIGM